MRYVLFAVPRPIGVAQDWQQFSDNVDARLEPHKQHVVRIADTVWMVDNQGAPAALAWLIATAEARKVAYTTAAFDTAPEWLPAGFDPRTSQP